MESRNRQHCLGLAAGFIALVPALFIAIASARAGHGDYFGAKVLFPVTLLSTRWTGSISWPSLVFAFIQFPLYGYLIGECYRRGKGKLGWAVAAFHAIAVALVLALPNPNFS